MVGKSDEFIALLLSVDIFLKQIKVSLWLESFISTEHSFQLKVHKNENFFGFDFEFCNISLLVTSKY